MNAKPEERRRALEYLESEPWLSDREIARRVGLGNKTVSRLREQTGAARRVGPGALRRDELARAAGVTERKLRRWHEHGLLPDPMRFWIGKRALLLYPPNSVELVSVVSELMSRYRDINRVALGLLARGWPVSERRVRCAYVRFLERQERWLRPLGSVFAAFREAKPGDPRTEALDKAVAWLETSIRARRLGWARRAAQIHVTGDVPTPDATWTYLENVAKIMVDGDLGSDEDVRGLLSAMPVQPSMPVGEQVRLTRAMHRAISLTPLRRVAGEAPIEEITRACDTVAHILMAYIALYDLAAYLSRHEERDIPLTLSAIFNPDPSFLAIVGLWLVSAQHDPEIGAQLTRWIDELHEPSAWVVRFALAQVAGGLPQLEAMAFTYLENRVGRALLLTPPDP